MVRKCEWNIDFSKDHFSLIPTINYANLYIFKIIGFYFWWLRMEYIYKVK
jgi:hypothetical protein